MWSKISNALKPRPHDDEIYQQHPYPYPAPSHVPFPTPGPKRSSKHSKDIFGSTSRKLGIRLPRPSRESELENDMAKENEEMGFRDQSTPLEGRRKAASGIGLKKRPSVFDMLTSGPVSLLSPGSTPLEESTNQKGNGNLSETHPEAPSLMKPLPLPDLSNIFDMSDDHRESPVPALAESGRVKKPSRALSESMFQAMIRESSPSESCTNDESMEGLVFSATPDDPFRANATTYYTPQVLIPDSPGQLRDGENETEGNGKGEGHVRTASREEDIIWSLKMQLALQQELCTQYEVDLGARDEMVESLERKLDTVEREGDKRKGVVRAWKKKVGELEKSVRGLEEEVEKGKETSLERSIMDEASGEALRMLHRRIGKLEREKGEWEKWEKVLVGEVEELRQIAKGSEEIDRESRIEALEEERNALSSEAGYLKERIVRMETEWSESQNQLATLKDQIESALDQREIAERERDELKDECLNGHHHRQELIKVLQGREDHITELDHECRYALDGASRLQDTIRERDAEIAKLYEQVSEHGNEAEQLRGQLTAVNHDHERVVDSHSRELREIAIREEEARQQMDSLIREKSEAYVLVDSIKGQVNALKNEVERLRRQVYELQQESADKEVKIVQLTKGRAQAKEDMQGLNIALDSKQQELELLKRRLGVRGTGGSTPAQPSKVARHRRDSSVLSTPGMARPPSAMSDTDSVKSGRVTPTRSSSSKVALAQSNSTRLNGTGVAPWTSTTYNLGQSIEGSMGPPPLKQRTPASGIVTPAAQKRTPAVISRSTAKPAAQTATPALHRHPSLTSEPKMKMITRRTIDLTTLSEQDGKENKSASIIPA